MVTVDLLLLVLAFLCFALAALNAFPSPRVNLTAAGLAFWTLSLIV